MNFGPILSDVREYLQSGNNNELGKVVNTFTAYNDGDFFDFFSHILQILPNDLSQNIVNNKILLPIVQNGNFNKRANPQVSNSHIDIGQYHLKDVPVVNIQNIINKINENIRNRNVTNGNNALSKHLKDTFNNVSWLQ